MAALAYIAVVPFGFPEAADKHRQERLFLAFIGVNRVRQDKPGRSSEMKGTHHVNYPFDM